MKRLRRETVCNGRLYRFSPIFHSFGSDFRIFGFRIDGDLPSGASYTEWSQLLYSYWLVHEVHTNQVGARSVHTPMAGWPAGALVPSSPKVRLGLAHPPAYAHGSPRPPSPAWLLRREASKK